MKKSLSGVLLAICILLTPRMVSAESACSYSQQATLNDLVANVKASYEYIERTSSEKGINADSGEEMDVTVQLYNISIMNLTEDIYVTVTNDTTGFNQTYYYSDTTDGTVEFEQDSIFTVAEYTINVYSNNGTCNGELYRTFTLKTPMYNTFSDIAVCQDYPNYYYCQQFIDADVEINYETFYNGLESYKALHESGEAESEEEKSDNKITEFYENHALVINIAAVIVVVMGVATIVILVKRKRSRVL